MTLDESSSGMAESSAYDETWTGAEIEPTSCVVIADFDETTTEDLDGSPASHLRAQLEALDPPPTVEECAVPRQVHISMKSDRASLQSGAETAVAVRDLCTSFGATTQWRDRAAE